MKINFNIIYLLVISSVVFFLYSTLLGISILWSDELLLLLSFSLILLTFFKGFSVIPNMSDEIRQNLSDSVVELHPSNTKEDTFKQLMFVFFWAMILAILTQPKLALESGKEVLSSVGEIAVNVQNHALLTSTEDITNDSKISSEEEQDYIRYFEIKVSYEFLIEYYGPWIAEWEPVKKLGQTLEDARNRPSGAPSKLSLSKEDQYKIAELFRNI